MRKQGDKERRTKVEGLTGSKNELVVCLCVNNCCLVAMVPVQRTVIVPVVVIVNCLPTQCDITSCAEATTQETPEAPDDVITGSSLFQVLNINRSSVAFHHCYVSSSAF